MSDVLVETDGEKALAGAEELLIHPAQAAHSPSDLSASDALEQLRIHASAVESDGMPNKNVSCSENRYPAEGAFASCNSASDVAMRIDTRKSNMCSKGDVDTFNGAECVNASDRVVPGARTVASSDDGMGGGSAEWRGTGEKSGEWRGTGEESSEWCEWYRAVALPHGAEPPALRALQPVVDCIRNDKNMLVAGNLLREVGLQLLSDPQCLSHADMTLLMAWASADWPPDHVPSFTIAVLRCLRNAVGVSAELRARAGRQPRLLQSLLKLLALLTRPADDAADGAAPAGRVALQLLGNITTSEAHCRAPVWDGCRQLLLPLLRRDHLTAMLLLQLLRDPGRAEQLLATPDCRTVLQQLLDLLAESESEWALLCVQQLTAAAGLRRLLPLLQPPRRALYVDVTLDGVERGALQLQPPDLLLVRESVQQFCGQLLSLRPDRPPASPSPLDAAQLNEARQLLQLLAMLTSDDRCPAETLQRCVRDHAPLVDAVVAALAAVHRAGGAFSALSKLSQVAATADDAGAGGVADQPSFGLKALLVRLLGNLVCGSAAAQRRARPAIADLLECCNLDARNPLLQQWAIVAIRHLCWRCPENQAEIADLSLQGVSPDAARELARLGVSAEQRAGGIRVASAPRPPHQQRR